MKGSEKVKVGIDMAEIERIRESSKNEKFLSKIFAQEELDYAFKKKNSAESLAAFFAAKEAFVKAMGSGFRGFSPKEIYIIHDENGKPLLRFSGKAAEKIKESNLKFDVSLTHTDTTAAAVVIAFKESTEGEQI